MQTIEQSTSGNGKPEDAYRKDNPRLHRVDLSETVERQSCPCSVSATTAILGTARMLNRLQVRSLWKRHDDESLGGCGEVGCLAAAAGPGPGPTPPPAPASLNTVDLCFAADRNGLFTAWNAIANLADMAGQVKVTIHAESTDGFDKGKLNNGVMEPLRQADLIE